MKTVFHETHFSVGKVQTINQKITEGSEKKKWQLKVNTLSPLFISCIMKEPQNITNLSVFIDSICPANTACLVCLCEGLQSTMRKAEEEDEGVPPSSTSLSEEHETEPDRWDKELSVTWVHCHRSVRTERRQKMLPRQTFYLVCWIQRF